MKKKMTYLMFPSSDESTDVSTSWIPLEISDHVMFSLSHGFIKYSIIEFKSTVMTTNNKEITTWRTEQMFCSFVFQSSFLENTFLCNLIKAYFHFGYIFFSMNYRKFISFWFPTENSPMIRHCYNFSSNGLGFKIVNFKSSDSRFLCFCSIYLRAQVASFRLPS